jgi:hypothetical protein
MWSSTVPQYCGFNLVLRIKAMFERSGKPEMQFWWEGKDSDGQTYSARAGFSVVYFPPWHFSAGAQPEDDLGRRPEERSRNGGNLLA